MAKKAGTPSKFIRVIRRPDGVLERSTSGNGYEIHGLHYHKKNRSYYRLVPVSGKPKKRAFLGRDLPEALQKFCRQTGC